MSIILNKFSSLITDVPDWTIWRRHCYILYFKAGKIMSLQRFSVYYRLLISYKLCIEHFFCISRVVGISLVVLCITASILLREMDLCGVYWFIELILLQNALVDSNILNLEYLYYSQIDDVWGHIIAEWVFFFNNHTLLNCIIVIYLNGGLHFC